MNRSVELKVYDLSGGLAKSLSRQLIGREIEGIWHTGVVVGEIEHFFGQGIQQCQQHLSPFGTPRHTLFMGDTEIPDDMIRDFLEDVAPRFNAGTYDLLSNNCNTFADALCEFLVGKGIPEYILGLPQQVMEAPMGQALLQMVQPMLQQRFSSATASGFVSTPLSTSTTPAVPQAAPVATAASDVEGSSAHVQHGADTARVPADAPKATGAADDKEEYKIALSREFFKAQEQGIQDANAAAAVAVRRVAELVQSGTVMPPEVQGQSCVANMVKQ